MSDTFFTLQTVRQIFFHFRLIFIVKSDLSSSHPSPTLYLITNRNLPDYLIATHNPVKNALDKFPMYYFLTRFLGHQNFQRSTKPADFSGFQARLFFFDINAAISTCPETVGRIITLSHAVWEYVKNAPQCSGIYRQSMIHALRIS